MTVALHKEAAARHPLWFLLFILKLLHAQQLSFPSVSEFLAAACPATVDNDVATCSLGLGSWTIQSASPAASLTVFKTNIVGHTTGGDTPDITSIGTRLVLPAQVPLPLLRVPANATLMLRNLHVSGAFLRVPQRAELPAPFAVDLAAGAQLRLVNVEVSVSCRSLSAYQAFACSQQLPSPYFKIDYGTVTFVSYTTPSLELLNATFTCIPGSPLPLASSSLPSSSALTAAPPPPCVAVIAYTGGDVLAVLESPARPPLPSVVPYYLYISRNLSLLDSVSTAGGLAPASWYNASRFTNTVVPPPRPLPPPPPASTPRSVITMSQDWLNISGSVAGTTRLDLGGIASLIRLGPRSRVALSNLHLVGLPLGPPGPAFYRGLALLRIPVWTFDFTRAFLGGGASPSARLALQNVRLELSAVEVVALARDIMAPELPTPTPPAPPPWSAPPPAESLSAPDTWVPVCVSHLEFFGDMPREAELLQPGGSGYSTGGAMPLVRSTSSSPVWYGNPVVLLRRAIFSLSMSMSYNDVVLEPATSLVTTDWRHEPLCQLLPLQPVDEPPRLQIDTDTDMSILKQTIWPMLLTTNVSNGRLYFTMEKNARLLMGPPVEGTLTFSQLQSYIDGAAVLLGGPLQLQLLDTQRVAAGINLRRSGASLTLRRVMLFKLATAGVHPLSGMAEEGRGTAAESSGTLDGAVRATRRRGTRRQLAVDAGSGNKGETGQRCRGCSLMTWRRSVQQQPSAQPPPPRPLLWYPGGWTPAGRDPTGGLPAGLANFTSCLWLLDFDRNHSSAAGGASSGRALLHSVVLVLPPAEMVLFTWVWSRSTTAGVMDPAVAEQLRDMLERSVLAGADEGSGASADSLTFSWLSWCGLEGENVTLASASAKLVADQAAAVAQLDAKSQFDVGSPMDLVLPISYGSGGGGGGSDLSLPPPSPSSVPPPSPPPLPAPLPSPTGDFGPGSSRDMYDILVAQAVKPDNTGNRTGNSTDDPVVASGMVGGTKADQPSSGADRRIVIIVAVCGVTAGLLASMLVCMAVTFCLRRRQRRRQRLKSPAAGAGVAADADTDTEAHANRVPTPTRDDDSNGRQSFPIVSAICIPSDVPQLTSAALPDTAELTRGSGSSAVQQYRQEAAATTEAGGRLPPPTLTAPPRRATASVAGGDPLSVGGGDDSDGAAAAAAAPGQAAASESAWYGSVTHGSGDGERLSRTPTSNHMASLELTSDLAAAAATPRGLTAMCTEGGGGDVLLNTNFVSLSPWAGATTTSGGPAVGTGKPVDVSASESTSVAMTVIGVSDEEQQQQMLLRNMARSLHSRLLHIREVVASVGQGASAAASASDELALQDTHRPTGRLPGTSEPSVDTPLRRSEGQEVAAASSVPPPRGDAVASSVAAAAGGTGTGGAETGLLTVTGELGRGAQGVVYRGRWRGIDVAVKSLLLHGPLNGRSPSLDLSGSAAFGGAAGPSAAAAVAPPALARHRALREAAISVAVSAHPNVVATYHVDACALGQHTGPGPGRGHGGGPPSAADCWKLTLISQLCDGGSLRNALASGLLARCVASGGTQPPPAGGAETSGDGSAAEATAAATAAVVAGAAGAASATPAVSSADGADTSVMGVRGGGRGSVDEGTTSSLPLQQQPVQSVPPPDQQSHELQPRVLLLVALDVACGLAQLHSRNVVHGDVSSDNVLLASLVVVSAPSSDCVGGGVGHLSGFTVSVSVGNRRSRIETYGTGSGPETSDQAETEDAWFSNSSDALALLADLPYEQARRRRPAFSSEISVADPNALAAAAAAAAALGRYGYVAKLCDFGLAEVLAPGQQHLVTPCRRSSAYTAPEVAVGGRVGPASDVYSWGILCWELATGMPLPALLLAPGGAAVRAWLAAAVSAGPLPVGRAAEEEKQQGQGQDTEALEAAALPPALLKWPTHLPHSLMVLVGECLRADPAGRPSARDVVQRLEHIIISL